MTEIKWREKYFTKETRKVLFEQAKWFQLKKETNPFTPSFRLKINEKPTCLRMNAPQLVLFEFDETKTRAKNQILKIGFLILQVYFDREPDETKKNLERPTLDDFLTFNEIFRYTDEPFKEHPKLVKTSLTPM